MRVDRSPVFPELEVEVRPGRPTRLSHTSNDVACPDLVPFANVQLREVRIPRFCATLVPDDHKVAISPLRARKRDGAIRRRRHLLSIRGRNIHSFVEPGRAGDRIGTPAEIGADPAGQHRQGRLVAGVAGQHPVASA